MRYKLALAGLDFLGGIAAAGFVLLRGSLPHVVRYILFDTMLVSLGSRLFRILCAALPSEVAAARAEMQVGVRANPWQIIECVIYARLGGTHAAVARSARRTLIEWFATPRQVSLLSAAQNQSRCASAILSGRDEPLIASVLILIADKQETRALREVARLAGGRGCARNNDHIRATAEDCYGALQAAVRGNAADVLLRPANSQTASQTLLRAPIASVYSESARLLRSVADPTEQCRVGEKLDADDTQQ